MDQSSKSLSMLSNSTEFRKASLIGEVRPEVQELRPSPAIKRPPCISVIMPVKDGEAYVETALKAVLGQTFDNLEVIVVDDGSRDRTPDILRRLAATDARLQIITNDTNIGIAGACNIALDAARGDYVARTDADDIAEPGWLAALHAVLEANPDLSFASVSARHIDTGGKHLRVRRLSHSRAEMRCALRLHMPIVNPASMFRRTGLPGAENLRYDTSFRSGAEDFDFFCRLLKVGNGVNLPDVLFNYRIHGQSISRKRWREQTSEAYIIARRQQEKELPEEVFEALRGFRSAFYEFEPTSARDILTGLKAAIFFDREGIRPEWAAEEVLRLYVMAMSRSRRSWIQTAIGISNSPGLALRGLVSHRSTSMEATAISSHC